MIMQFAVLTACLCCRAETGLLEKQGCFYFQALSALATVERNIAFNGPRAAVNFSARAITAILAIVCCHCCPCILNTTRGMAPTQMMGSVVGQRCATTVL
jgi:hypothetical protein